MLTFSVLFICVFLANWVVLAHPGHNVAEEAAERKQFFKRSPKTIRSCASTLKARGHESASTARRQALVNHLRVKRGLEGTPLIHRRDFTSYNFSHVSDNSDISLNSDETVLFSDNSSCTLQSETTEGPYYVKGELIRENLVDGEEGVPLFLDIQILDTATCEPVPALYTEIWSCNSTGVYSGVVANGNGNSNDTTNLNNTALRGIQQTDLNGVVQFNTIFPGHYTGRATHIHVLAHSLNSTTVRLNRTLLDANASSSVHVSHVGQLFFDQSLISKVETESPYSTNSQDVTLNADDGILAGEADATDPFVEYVLLGDNVSSGIVAWISIGIDTTQDRQVSNAAAYYEDGGVANGEGGMGLGSGGAPPDMNATLS